MAHAVLRGVSRVTPHAGLVFLHVQIMQMLKQVIVQDTVLPLG